jgi:hypothetical protein
MHSSATPILPHALAISAISTWLFFGFRNSNIFMEQNHQPCIPRQMWRTRSLYCDKIAWTPEVCSQKSTVETSVVRKQLVEKHFHGNEYACINQRVIWRLTPILWLQRITEESTVRLGVLYQVHINFVQAMTETSRREFERPNND